MMMMINHDDDDKNDDLDLCQCVTVSVMDLSCFLFSSEVVNFNF